MKFSSALSATTRYHPNNHQQTNMTIHNNNPSNLYNLHTDLTIHRVWQPLLALQSWVSKVFKNLRRPPVMCLNIKMKRY